VIDIIYLDKKPDKAIKVNNFPNSDDFINMNNSGLRELFFKTCAPAGGQVYVQTVC
jgi:hypothetical protein